MRKHGSDDFSDFSDLTDDAPRSARMRRRGGFDDDPQPTRSGRLTEAERARLARVRDDAYTKAQELPPGTDRWSTWGDADQGPAPRPEWLVTDLAAADTELGVLKTGKEADVFLLERAVPGGASCVLAAKRYRSGEHRLFHRDAGYLEGRRVRRSREMRAMGNRSSFGRNLIAEQWAVAEFAALSRLWTAGAPVPYPVQRDGTELLLEYLRGDDPDSAAPRLAQLRPPADELRDLWEQMVHALELFASLGLAHGDLSAYNTLVRGGELVLIDLPQVVDVIANPGGPEFLARDVANIASWFRSRGLPEDVGDPGALTARLLTAAGI
ncbi:serine/threonine protein kinase [Actinokineospora spheciospongiae]|uniref:non-specific serine/threonine protein kinase n=1 Tax=Actinokineospora spheciospongiae TaxID=909613 RepID=W7IGG0_9PSEU|nr:RIO1 family regulatory kinase/ATPase [Actinokineospora spheciospongiae]EWC59980.1 serine/threonine protein kinase [Actinokineospora spheciospongiae]PWW62432.1 RIO kinase 1 [Actinokineospora spheciospongiae]